MTHTHSYAQPKASKTDTLAPQHAYSILERSSQILHNVWVCVDYVSISWKHTVLILHKYTQSNDSAGVRMRKRWTVFAVVAVALLLVCIYAFHKAEANAKAAAAAQAKAAAEDKAALVSPQSVIQVTGLDVATVAGTTVANCIVYGLYWMVTQGD